MHMYIYIYTWIVARNPKPRTLGSITDEDCQAMQELLHHSREALNPGTPNDFNPQTLKARVWGLGFRVWGLRL